MKGKAVVASCSICEARCRLQKYRDVAHDLLKLGLGSVRPQFSWMHTLMDPLRAPLFTYSTSYLPSSQHLGVFQNPSEEQAFWSLLL